MNNRHLYLAILLVLGMVSPTFATEWETTSKEGPLSISLSAEKTNCPDDPNGSATVSVTGGKSPYSYQWSNGGNTATINNLLAGGYFITVTDALGATKNSHISVEATNQLQVSFDQSSIACANQTDGRIIANPEGGVAPYTYQWDNGSKESFIEDIGNGMYMVTITDANGCRAEEVVMVEEPDPIRLKADIFHVSCGETADGSMTINVTGGVAPYTYLWEFDGKGGASRTGLKAMHYNIYVTDANGCKGFICPKVIQSQPPLLTTSFKPETCPGEGDGIGYVTANGDSPPYRFEWPNEISQFNQAINLTAGTYTVTVTNFRNCSATIDVVVGQAGGGFGFTVETNGASCGNAPNGTAKVNITGGVGPFTYQWINENTNTVISNNAAIASVSAGNYEVHVTDANGCFGQRDVMIVEKPVPTISATAINGKVCFGEKTGSARATAQGGEGSYTYQWSNGQTTREVSDLSAGTYSVTATDINGCQASTNVVIAENPKIVINEQVRNLLCNNELGGEIIANVSGGSGNYTYAWSNGTSADRINNIKAGTYFLTVTDDEGCQISKGINISEPSAINLSVSSENAADDRGSTDGSASVTAAGGTAPYTYVWSNGATTATIDNISTGTYTVTVKDANGCEKTTEIIVGATCTLKAEITNTRSAGCLGNNGSITVTVRGAQNGVNFQWSNGATTSSITGLTPGKYSVTVTDGNDCDYTLETTIDDPRISINEQVTNILCHNTIGGEIVANVTGGTGDYQYTWSNGSTADRINNIAAGTYALTVVDANGCQTSKEITIGSPPAITLTLSTQNAADDKGSTDGAASVVATGGTAPYTYEWSNGATTASINNVAAGTYTVTVTDANGCKQTIEVTVGATCTLQAAISDVRAESCAGNDGAITLTTSGAQNGISYIWTNGATTSSIAGLTSGFYGVTITDGNDCEYASGTFVGDGCNCTEPVLENVLVFEANCGKSDGSITIEMAGDNNAFNYQWSDPSISGTQVNNLSSGSYMVTITAKDNSQCSIIETINVGNTNVGPITIIQNEPEICNGRKGTVLLVPGALTFNWSDGGTGGFRDDLSAGEYLVTVTIPNLEGCMDILSINVGLESGLSLTPVINRRPDCGQSNGSASINVAGGSGDYSYSWGAATNNNLPSGTYNITVTDKLTNCMETVLFTLLDEVNGATVGVDSIKNVSCAGAADGSVQLSVAITGSFDGTPEISIVDGKGKTYSNESLPVGNYCVIVKNGSGCLAGETCFEITEPERLLVDVSVIPKTCSVENTILLTSRGGNGLYTYDWADQDGQINPRDRRAIENGTYFVTVTDQGGCRIPVEGIAINGECFICALDVTAAIEAIPECGLPNGAATINVDNSFGNLSYSWGENPNRTDLPAGTYTVTVTDDFRGCDTTVSFTLTEPDLPMEATIEELIVCPDATGKLAYDLSNFRCFKQPTTVVITDEAGTIYDENALPPFGNYIFVVSDGDGTELNRQFFSVEGYEPIIANANTLDEGCTTLGEIDLSLAAATSNYTIQWGDLTGENQPADRTALSEGTYSVTITDKSAAGCSVTQTYLIDKDTGIDAEIDNIALTCDNAPVQLNLEGEGIVKYEWSPAVFIMQGQGTATPTILTSETAQMIKVKATNAFGCEIEKEVRVVSVQTNPPGGITSSPQCDGLTIDFSSEGVSSEYYRWNFGDGNTSDATNPTHTYANAGDYEVTLELKPNVPCAADRGIIASTDLNLVDEARTEADFEVKYDPCQDEGVVNFKDISTVKPGNITSWNWDFGNGMTSTEQNPVITLTEGTDLEVTLEIKTDIGCDGAVSETRSFAVVNLPKLANAIQICPGVPTELNPNPGSGATYEWSPAELLDDPNAANPIATTFKPVDFTVQITKGECIREENVRADVPREQEYELSEDLEVCNDSEQLLTVDGPANSTIEWTNINTGEVVGSVPEIMAQPGLYEVKLTDENNCPITDQVAIDNYEINASIDNGTDPCEGGIGMLTINNNGEAFSEILWKDAEGIISADLTMDNIDVEPSATTDYEVTVKNEFGCEATLTETVQVSVLEDMVIIKERDTIFKGETTDISIEPQGDYTVEWEVSPTLESMSGFMNSASPEETTTYKVTITDTETNCTIEREVTVFVRDVFCGAPNIFFPNAFSPNGDGQNDVLYVRGVGLSQIYFAVYNRWGEQVFESNSQDIGWDGTFKGETVETDVYGYYLRVTCFDGEVYETQGNVTVLN